LSSAEFITLSTKFRRKDTMEEKVLKQLTPKTKQAALKQGASILIQIQNLKRKKENLMSNIEKTQEKLERLQKTLQEQQTQLSVFNKETKNWEEAIEDLKMRFQLTQSEILEVQSELLRSQIKNLEKQCGLQETGQTERF
jgi:chromosome segregation ATPase